MIGVERLAALFPVERETVTVEEVVMLCEIPVRNTRTGTTLHFTVIESKEIQRLCVGL